MMKQHKTTSCPSRGKEVHLRSVHTGTGPQEGADAKGPAKEGQQLEGVTLAYVLGHGLLADPSLFGVRLLNIDPDTASGLLTLAALDAQANGPVYLG